MDSKNFAIGVLCTTAVVLLAALVILNTGPKAVWASGMTTSGGDYVLTVGTDASADEELLYVIDSVAQRLIVYRFDSFRKQIQLIQGIELSELREAAGPPSQPQGKRRGSSRRRP